MADPFRPRRHLSLTITTQAATSIEIDAGDLPLHCPTAKTPVWNYHPRMFLDIADTGEVKCLYCGIVYKLVPGIELKGHH